MNNFLTLEALYRNNIKGVPETIKNGIGHFNIFRLEEMMMPERKPIVYSRRDYYKITLITKGNSNLHYADKSVGVNGKALVFTNPMIPYSWEKLDEEQNGFVCIFTETFFNGYGNLKDYPIFSPGEEGIVFLSDEQLTEFNGLFLKMFDELRGDYVFKYDVLRNIVFEIIHYAQKMQPVTGRINQGGNASERITTLFMELLERIFPIEFAGQQLRLHTPASFAAQLNVHVNHLNRALKSTTGKTTSQLIAGRLVQEARVLLKRTELNISEIAWCLKFEEANHFTAFFKKMTGLTPKAFRES